MTQCQHAEYNQQIFWRDITSTFDMTGPYFSRADCAVCSTYDHRFVIASVKETRVSQACKFSIVGPVCDGASSDLASIKLLCQGKGRVYHLGNEEEKLGVKPRFVNHYEP